MRDLLPEQGLCGALPGSLSGRRPGTGPCSGSGFDVPTERQPRLELLQYVQCSGFHDVQDLLLTAVT